MMTTRAKRWGRTFAYGIGIVLATASVGFSAELVAAEVDGGPADRNLVTVAQGQHLSFSVEVHATGSIRCAATPDSPATATIDTSYAISSSGGLTLAGPSTTVPFYAGVRQQDGSCQVTWAGDPTRQRYTATVTVDRQAPVGDYSARLRYTLFTPLGSGPTLRDDTATFVTFRVVQASDIDPPVVECSEPIGTSGANGWYVSDVRHDCTAFDTGSGLADAADAAFSLGTTGEGAVLTGARTVLDVAGNSTTVGPFGPYNVDLTDPSVSVTSPTPGQVFLLGATAAASYACSDTPAGSGVASCVGTIGDGAALDTASVGTKTLSVTATDTAGRSTAMDVEYRVVYDWAGYFAPATEDSVVKAGAAFPLKWTLNGVEDLSSYVAAESRVVSCTMSLPDLVPIETAGQSGLSYDATSDRYTLVWKTDKSWGGKCLIVTVHLKDGTDHPLRVFVK